MEDFEVLRQEAILRARFGEAGVKRFWEAITDVDARSEKKK